MKQLGWLATLIIAAAALCLWIPKGSGQTDDAELWRHRNLGKALFESPTGRSEAPAELKKALALAPNSFRDRLNYGLALLQSGDVSNGIAELERAQKQNPNLPNTWFNLGVAYKRQGRYPEAIRQFQRMVELVPDEPVSHYNLGLLFVITERLADAIQQFQMAAKLDPRLVAPRVQIHNYYRLHGDDAAAESALADFQQAKERQQAAGETEDMDWCPYAELYDPIQARPAGLGATAPAPLRFDDRKLAGTADPKTAGLLVLDADGDGNPDLLAWSRNGLLLYRKGSDPVENSGLGGIRNVVSAAAGDFDNDGLPDLCVITESGARLFHNTGGRFEEAGAKLPGGPFHSAVWLDYDHDYDLDLFLLGAKPVLLRNQGKGAFEDFTSHFPFAAGEALQGEPFRAIPDTKGIDLAISYAGRKGVLYRDQLRGVFEAVPLDAVPANAAGLRAVDVNNDSWNDLVFSTPAGISMALNRGGKFEAERTKATGAFVLADLENRGFADLIADDGVSRSQGLARFAGPASQPGLPAATAWAEADFDGDGHADLAAVAPDGSLHLLANRSAVKNEWLRVALTGVKNLKMAPGAEVEVKAGNQYRKRIFDGVPLLFGLGRYRQADTVRITWPNGMIQNQPNERTSRTLTVKEAPRLSGSCPMIFTWNGRAFQFITDVLGVAPLGASSSDGQYFPVDHDEYVQIPGGALAVEDGRYEIRITEELHEVSYLDQAELIALDHPQTTEIFTNEKFKSPPFPEFRLFGVRQRIYPIAARDGSGRDVLARILRRDRVYASGFRHDYAGVADLHSLTLDFGPCTARDNRAVLLLNGWVDWADGSTFLGASERPGGGLVFPYLQVKDPAGQWRTVVEDMGIPSGKPKTIAVDLTGKFLSASREVRIVTNLCVYWDEIFLSEDTAPPPVRLTPLGADSAELRLRGFSRTVIDAWREQPERFEYARWTPAAIWNQTPGLYTRYGDVRELALAADDRFVIMGAGDELRLLFPARGLPALPSGWRRDFLLLVDGWAKDADANTAFSQSVEPLPFHAMSRYPYPAEEHYPDDELHRRYRKDYNTRVAMRFVQPLVAGSR
ncbi:MAG: FG-GAP-like repeat-containing protein [Acidobacteriia bacterium]|nr:FG-GAP-like repeat-containing protein [Terriglobia bacterium]